MNVLSFGTGRENHSESSIASSFNKIWKYSSDQMCHARMIFNQDGTPADYIFLDINPALERELGFTREQAVGRRFTAMFPLHTQGWIRKCGEVVHSGQTLAIVEYYPAQDVWYEVQVFALNGNNEFMTISRDITERKRAEDALRKSEKHALELVEKLRQADQNKNAFISMLSHELRNPLASIMLSLDFLDKLPADEKMAGMALEIAKRQGKQLTRLVDDLLDVTRINQNKVILKKERVELNGLIKTVVKDYQMQFAKNKVELAVNLTSPLFLEADPSRLNQIVCNLLHNAVKFTSNNDRVTVTVALDPLAWEAVIMIQDTGMGIEPNYLECLFEQFTQVGRSLDRNHGGLGLGLAIVKGMVELHGGNVKAFSGGRDKGATFTVRLPLLKENIGVPESCGGLEPIVNESLTVLLIEDNKDLSRVMGELIAFVGYRAETAYNGTEGIALAKELRPDVIICDLGLPGMSGYEVARLIRKDPKLRNIFLIALSGYAQPEDIERSIEAGFDRHLGKPVSIETLQQVFNSINNMN